MTNRVTDQTTQNGLIEKFRLKGVLPEMSVEERIVPVVQVASLADALTISEFEKWRSVFSGTLMLVDASNSTLVANCLTSAVVNVLASNIVVCNGGSVQSTASYGCALPGGAVGSDATDGIYRITITQGLIGTTRHRVDLTLRDQAAFGLAVALGTNRGNIGAFNLGPGSSSNPLVWDAFLLLRTTELANAVVMTTTAGGTNGTGSVSMTITKLIDELPPNVIFP